MGQVVRATVVLVEDREDIRQVVPLMLDVAELDCVTYATSAEAIAAAAASEDPPALLITDANLDDGTGRDVADAWRTEFPELPILVTSGRTAAELTARGVIAPGDPFLPKPFTLEGLLTTVRHLTAPMRDVA